jgi:hypothetical protein
VCHEVKPVGKPDAVAPHVRFDERGWETGLHATAPILDSTDERRRSINEKFSICTAYMSSVSKIFSGSPTHSGLNRKAICGHKENTAAGFWEY